MSLYVRVVSILESISNTLSSASLRMRKNGNNVKIEKPRKN